MKNASQCFFGILTFDFDCCPCRVHGLLPPSPASFDLLLFFQYSDNQTYRLGVSDALGRPVFYDAPLKDIGQSTQRETARPLEWGRQWGALDGSRSSMFDEH